MNQPDSALAYYQAALRRQPEKPALVESYKETRRPFLAAPQLEAAWQKDSSSVALALDIGTEKAKYALRRETEVLPWFDKAQELLKEPLNQLYYIHKGRGDVYYGMSEWRKAVSEYRSAQVYKPSFINTYPRIGFCLEKLGDKKGALQWYQRFLETAKPGDQWYDYATKAVADLKAALFMEE